jgi:hypothetical protein
MLSPRLGDAIECFAQDAKDCVTDRRDRTARRDSRCTRLPRGATFGDALALAQARQAIKGETAAAKEMREAIEGRSIMQADFEGKNAAMTIIFDMPMPTSPVIHPAPQPDHGESE